MSALPRRMASASAVPGSVRLVKDQTAAGVARERDCRARARSRTRPAASPARGWTGRTRRSPKRPARASRISAIASARWISARWPPGLRSAAAAPAPCVEEPALVATCASRRCASGDACMPRLGSKGGFISTQSATPSAMSGGCAAGASFREIEPGKGDATGEARRSPAARAARSASDKSAGIDVEAENAHGAGRAPRSRRRLRRRRCRNRGMCRPHPAGTSGLQQRGVETRRDVPSRGWRTSTLPPRKRSRVTSSAAETGVMEPDITRVPLPARPRSRCARALHQAVLDDQDAARQDAERALHDAHVLIERSGGGCRLP